MGKAKVLSPCEVLALPPTGRRSDGIRRIEAATIICLAGPKARAAAPVLAKIVNDPTDPAWESAIFGLSLLGVPRPEACPGLISALRHRLYSVRQEAAAALEVMRDDRDAVLVALEEALTDQFRVVRFAAARALGSIGSAGSSAVPALRRLESDDYESVRREARKALRRIQARYKRRTIGGLNMAREKTRILDGFGCPHCGKLIRVDVLPRPGRRKKPSGASKKR